MTFPVPHFWHHSSRLEKSVKVEIMFWGRRGRGARRFDQKLENDFFEEENMLRTSYNQKICFFFVLQLYFLYYTWTIKYWQCLSRRLERRHERNLKYVTVFLSSSIFLLFSLFFLRHYLRFDVYYTWGKWGGKSKMSKFFSFFIALSPSSGTKKLRSRHNANIFCQVLGRLKLPTRFRLRRRVNIDFYRDVSSL